MAKQIGTGGSDSMVGTDASERFITNGGFDTIIGNGGDDIVIFNVFSGLEFHGGAGFDTLDVSAMTFSQNWNLLSDVEGYIGCPTNDTVYVTDEHAVVDRKWWGGGGADVFNAGAGDDRLFGEDGNDNLIGKDGRDRFIGGTGTDELVGGAGRDVFIYRAAADSYMFTDWIRDLTNRDVIDFSAIDADGDAGNGNQAFRLVSAFDHQTGEVILTYNAGNDRTSIVVDINGDALQDMLIEADGDHRGFVHFIL
ncbi:MAG: M10 family metallopeptidase C-terminal domain-containing protein [Caulobacteraceae bacterium]